MNAEVKREWVEALRSGEYRQTKGTLARTVGGEPEFCCLGVLCEVLRPQLPGLRVEDVRNPVTDAAILWYDNNDGLLPPSVRSHAGLAGGNPTVRVKDAYTFDHKRPVTLSFLNDELEFTFDQIADLIEEQL